MKDNCCAVCYAEYDDHLVVDHTCYDCAKDQIRHYEKMIKQMDKQALLAEVLEEADILLDEMIKAEFPLPIEQWKGATSFNNKLKAIITKLGVSK